MLLLETGPLEAGNHTLTVTLTGCVEQTLFIDYILYSPSFDTLSAMPNLTEPTTPLPSSPSFETQHSPVAAIAGGVVASVAIITVLVILIIWYRRRHPYSSADEEPMRYSACALALILQLNLFTFSHSNPRKFPNRILFRRFTDNTFVRCKKRPTAAIIYRQLSLRFFLCSSHQHCYPNVRQCSIVTSDADGRKPERCGILPCLGFR